MSAAVLYVIGSVVCLVIILEMVRRRALREKYAVLWLVIAVVILVVGVFPGTLVAVSEALGVEVPANLLFFVASIVLLLVSVQQSAELGRLEEKTRRLAEECAETRLEVERVKGAHRPPDGPHGDRT